MGHQTFPGYSVFTGPFSCLPDAVFVGVSRGIRNEVPGKNRQVLQGPRTAGGP